MTATQRTFRDIGLARISKDDLRQGKGTDRQEKDIRRVSANTGGEICEMFIEDDVPASRFNKRQRQKYNQILDLLRSGQRDRIIVYRLDRLTRIPRVLEDLIDLCEEKPFLVVNLHGSMDLRTAEGRKSARDRVSDGAYESDLISERTKRAFDELAEAGLPHGVRAFGYACNGLRPCDGPGCCHDRPCPHRPRHKRCCRVPGCPHDATTIIEPEAEEFRWATKAVLVAGESLNAVARRWNGLGFLTPNNYLEFDGSTVKCILTNPRHAGLRVHRGDYRIYDCSHQDHHLQGQHDPECNVIGKRRGAWDPIITVEEHDALVALLTSPTRGRRPPSRRTPFTGLFTTIEGLRLARNLDRKTPVYQWQNQPGRGSGTPVSIRAEPLEALVLELLFEAAESGKLAAKVAERRRRRQTAAAAADAGEDPAEIQKELAQLAEDKANPDIGLTRAEWLAQRSMLLRRLEAAEAAKETAIAAEPLDGVDVDLRARWSLREDEGGYSADRKRAILASVFDRVVVHPRRNKTPAFDPGRVEPIWRE